MFELILMDNAKLKSQHEWNTDFHMGIKVYMTKISQENGKLMGDIHIFWHIKDVANKLLDNDVGTSAL